MSIGAFGFTSFRFSGLRVSGLRVPRKLEKVSWGG